MNEVGECGHGFVICFAAEKQSLLNNLVYGIAEKWSGRAIPIYGKIFRHAGIFSVTQRSELVLK